MSKKLSKTILPGSLMAFGLVLGSAGFAADSVQASATESTPAVATQGYAALMAEGESLWQQGQLPQAAEQFRQAADLDPRSVDARMKLGGVYVAEQKFPAGREAFKEAISIDPKNANAFVALGIAYLHTGSGPALAAFDQALELDPSLYKKLDPIIKSLGDKHRRMSQHGLSEGNRRDYR